MVNLMKVLPTDIYYESLEDSKVLEGYRFGPYILWKLLL